MQIIPHYSLVIFPAPEHIALVKEFKQKLRKQIGWFGSFNAKAHITVANFSDDTELSIHLPKIKSFGDNQPSGQVRFDHFDKFGDKTFFIGPDESSQTYLDSLIRNFHNHLGIKPGSIHAHISIARQLDAQKMQLAEAIFNKTEVDFSFTCDALYLRKFNEQTKQYSDIADKFSLEGKSNPTLFD